MTDSADDDIDGTFLVLRIAAERENSPDSTCEQPGWCAHVCDVASPLAGLYAFGASLDAVRDGLAILAWEAVTKGELEPFEYTVHNLAGIQVALTSIKDYDAEWLIAAAADYVA